VTVKLSLRYEIFIKVKIQVEDPAVVSIISLKMDAARSFEMVVFYHNTTQHHNPEDFNIR
jgi:hypothetical protein